MIGCTIRLKKRRAAEESEWLVNLLGSKFFGACVDHRDLRKNERNVFCIDCNLCFCKHCIISSPPPSSSSSSNSNSNPNPCVQFHRRLQICRYVYHDVVRLLDIQKHLDCSKIQTYKINGEKAVHLNPRPQLRDAKTCKSKGGASCEACGRHIQDLPNRFCSIACKVAEITKEDTHKMISYPIPDFGDYSWKENYDPQGNINESESTLSSTGSFEEIQASWLISKLRPKKLLHKRKGVPRRAPLC